MVMEVVFVMMFALILGFLWMIGIFDHKFRGFVKAAFIKAAINTLNENERHHIKVSLQCLKHDEDLFGEDDSEWSFVSEEKNVPTTRNPSSDYSKNGCKCRHSRTTRRGSNGFIDQIRCKDCGEVLKRVRKTRDQKKLSTGK